VSVAVTSAPAAADAAARGTAGQKKPVRVLLFVVVECGQRQRGVYVYICFALVASSAQALDQDGNSGADQGRGETWSGRLDADPARLGAQALVAGPHQCGHEGQG